jgi:hypothetical protein
MELTPFQASSPINKIEAKQTIQLQYNIQFNFCKKYQAAGGLFIR